MKRRERGAASINIELRDGLITVRHASTGEVLVDFEANEGAWTTIWDGIHLAKNL
jgi:hypothetical protein